MVRRHILTKYKPVETASEISTHMSNDDVIHFEACFPDPGSNASFERGLTCSRSFARATIIPPTNSSNGGKAPGGSDGSHDKTAFKFAATVFPDRLIAMKGRERATRLGRSCSSRNLVQTCPEHCEPTLVLEAHRSCESSPLKARPESQCHEMQTILHEQCDDPGKCEGFNYCPGQQVYPTQNRYFNALDTATSIRTALQRSQQMASDGCCQTVAPANDGVQGGMCVSKNRSLERLRVLNPTPNLYNPSNLESFRVKHRCRQAVPQGLATVLGPRMPLDIEFQIQKRAPRGLAAVIVDRRCGETEMHQQQEQQQMEMQEEQQQQTLKMLEEQQQLQLLQQQQQELQTQQQQLQKQQQFHQRQQLLMQKQQLQNQQQQLKQLKQQQEEEEEARCSSISIDSCSDNNCETFETLEPPLYSSSISLDPNDDLLSLDPRGASKRKRLSMRSASFEEPFRQSDPSNEGSLHRQLERMSFKERTRKSWKSLPRNSLEGYLPQWGNPSVYRDAAVLNERCESNAHGSSKASMVSFDTSAARTSGSGRSTSRCRRAETESNIRNIVKQAVQQQLNNVEKALQDAVQQEMDVRSSEVESSLSESSDEPQLCPRFPSRVSLSSEECYAEKIAADAKNALEILDKTQAELSSKIRSQSRSKRHSHRRPSSGSSGSADGWTHVSVSSCSPDSGSIDASASTSFGRERSRRKSSTVQPSQPSGISYEDRMASITQLLNSMNSVTQLLNSLPVRGGDEPPGAQVPGQQGSYSQIPGQQGGSFSQVPGQRGSFSQIPGQPGSFSQIPGQQEPGFSLIPGQQGSYSQVPGQQGSYSQFPGQQGSYSQFPGQQGSYSQVPGQPGSFSQILGQQDNYSPFAGQQGSFQIPGLVPGQQLPGYSIQVPMDPFNGRRASQRASISGRRLNRRGSQRKSIVPEESAEDSEGSEAVPEYDGDGDEAEEGESEDLQQIEEQEQEGEQSEAEQDESSEQAEGMAANYQPAIQSQTIDHMLPLLQSQKLNQTDRMKPNVAQMPREFQSNLVLKSHTAQSLELFQPQTDGKRSLLSIVYVMLQELEVLESRCRQKSAAYGLSSPTNQQLVLE